MRREAMWMFSSIYATQASSALSTSSTKLTQVVGRQVDVVELNDAEAEPAFVAQVVAGGRVLVDREDMWPGLRRREARLRRLREMGHEPSVSGRLVIDPAQDMPQLRFGSVLPFGASEEASAAWLAHWPDQKLPALAGRTPRRASRRIADQPRLEALLRELEHDADLLAQRGVRAPDVGRVRTELQMPADQWR